MALNFLELENKTVVVAGVANKKSVGFHIGKRLQEVGARVIWVVRSEARRDELTKRLAPGEILVCDVEREDEIVALGEHIAADHDEIHGFVHSIAYANYAAGPKSFHETGRADFLQAVDISCFSLIRLSRALAPAFADGASVVTISISDTRMAAENYGYMAPVKAALDSAVVFLAKSFARAPHVRFNAVQAGLLKTSSSAGIPGYLESYLFAEACTLRKRGLETREVADTAVFLLSPRSSGINAQGIVVDAGMGVNYFDREVVERSMRVEEPSP